MLALPHDSLKSILRRFVGQLRGIKQWQRQNLIPAKKYLSPPRMHVAEVGLEDAKIMSQMLALEH